MQADVAAGELGGTYPNPTVNGTHSGSAHQLHKLIRKTVTETVNNDAALQNDDAFSFAIGANEVWAVDAYLSIDVKIVSQLRWTWTLPAGASMMMLFILLGDNLTAANAVTKTLTSPGTAVTSGAAITLGHLYMHGTFVNGANAGTAQFQWAQQTATIEDTSVLINSYLEAHRIA